MRVVVVGFNSGAREAGLASRASRRTIFDRRPHLRSSVAKLADPVGFSVADVGHVGGSSSGLRRDRATTAKVRTVSLSIHVHVNRRGVVGPTRSWPTIE